MPAGVRHVVKWRVQGGRRAPAKFRLFAERLNADLKTRKKEIMSGTYLDWVAGNTRTKWWHDSAEAAELDLGLKRGAIGVTTNPFLANLALIKDRQLWASEIDLALARNLPPEQKAEALTEIAVTKTAAKLMPEFERSQGRSGLVCAQVNPMPIGDRERSEERRVG